MRTMRVSVSSHGSPLLRVPKVVGWTSDTNVTIKKRTRRYMCVIPVGRGVQTLEGHHVPKPGLSRQYHSQT